MWDVKSAATIPCDLSASGSADAPIGRSRRSAAIVSGAKQGSIHSLLACAALLAACELAQAQSPASAAPEVSEYACVIEPEQVVKLASPIVGVIARLDVDRGDIVRKGQVLGKLEDAVETASLALARARASNEHAIKSAEARLEFLHRKHGRIDALHTKSVSSLAALQEAEAERNVAEQQLREAELNREVARLEVRHMEEVVNQRTLRSPLDGVVVERLLQVGEYRNEQTPILTLAQIDRLRVEVFVPTARYGAVRIGSSAEVRPEPPVGGRHAATVTVVDRVLDAASGTFGVRLTLPNPDLALPAGIRCSIQFEKLAAELHSAERPK
jgi:RND family efflux transporter MFP subunit